MTCELDHECKDVIVNCSKATCDPEKLMCKCEDTTGTV